MSAPGLRPTFTVKLHRDRESAIEEIRARLAADERFSGRWRGKGRWAEIHLPHIERRLWSPHLSIRLDEPDDGQGDGCTLFGRFAPHPEVWTFFMFLYFGIAFIVVFGGTFGYVQWASNEPAWALWSVWIGVPLMALIHLAGRVGQRLGHDQMVELKGELEDVIEGL